MDSADGEVMFNTISAPSSAVQDCTMQLQLTPHAAHRPGNEMDDLKIQMQQLAEAILQTLGPVEPTAASDEPEVERPCGKAVAQVRKLHQMSRAAEDLYRFRRSRDAMLPSALLGEPAWDMLLDLFIHEVEGRKISITSLCLASSAPSTTALRYIDLLEKHGLLSRTKCTTDQRVTFVHLTRTALMKLTDLLEQRC